MATAIHVNGVAQIKIGLYTAGPVAVTTELLGHALDGVDIEPEIHIDPVFADTGGGTGGVPVDFQEIGQVARISADVIVYDEAVLTKVRKRPSSSAEGLLGTTGSLIVAGALYQRVLILSPGDSVPYNFPCAITSRWPVRLSTRRTIYRVQWLAFAPIGTATAALGSILYNTTTSG